jgi:hypothetical protein
MIVIPQLIGVAAITGPTANGSVTAMAVRTDFFFFS